MDQLSQWQIHAISDNVTHLSQQTETKAMAAVRVREGVTGKTYPFQRIAAVSMTQVTTRDGDTTYINPTLTKRRANLLDFAVAALIDDFDVLKTLTNPQSEVAQAIVASRNRQLDDLIIGVAGLSDTGTTAGMGTGGILGYATTVDEGAESTSQTALGTGQQILHGSTNLTMSKIRNAGELMDSGDVNDQDRYFFYSPKAMRSLLSDTQVTSSDYSSIEALRLGRFPMDATWYGFKWRMSTRLPSSATNIRSCIAVQKQAVGLAVGTIQGVEVTTAVHKWNNPQVVLKLSAGGVRVDDLGVVQVDVDESK